MKPKFITLHKKRNPIKSLLISLSLLLGSTLSQAQSVELKDELAQRLDSYLNACESNGFWGAVSVSQNGRTILNKGYGPANLEMNAPNSPRTVFDIGSNTKQFTAAAIMKLVELKRLDLQDPLHQYFDSLPQDKRNITIHQLLAHISGLVDSLGRDFDQITMDQYLSKLWQSNLLHPPGTAYRYSNAGYTVLARIIELVSHQDYETFLNQNLFQPAGMTQTGYLLPQWEENNLAYGYARNVVDLGTTIHRYQKDGGVSPNLLGNGGINSTLEDMVKWMTALTSHKILPKALLDTMTTPHLGPDSGAYRYGYGWTVSKTPQNTLCIRHNGANGSFAHTIIWRPAEAVLLLFSTNAANPQVEAMPSVLESMIFDADVKAQPIVKNAYYLVDQFIKTHPPDQSHQLQEVLQEQVQPNLSQDVLNRLAYMSFDKPELKGWPVALFKMNLHFFPEKGNLWDSLGEGYLHVGDKDQAKQCFQKALALKPETNCNWCENSTEQLKRLSLDPR